MSTFTHRGIEWESFASNMVVKTNHQSFLMVEDGQIRYRHIDGAWISLNDNDARDLFAPVLEHFGLMPAKTPAPQERFKPGVPTEINAMKPDDQITWSFDAPKEDVDIARILREARAEGALEVAIKVGDKSMTYVHRSVDGLCNTWAEATGRPTLDGFDSIVDGCFLDVFGWSRSRFPMLAEATAWRNLQEQAAAQQKPKVRVTVTGVK